MATFELNSRTKIGSFKWFKGVNEVIIKKSLNNYLDTCVIKLPASARLKRGDVSEPQSVLTAKQFTRGDAAQLYLGYNSNMIQEFEGFVSRVNMTTPCEVECEGYAFQLRDKPFNHSWKSTNLRQVLAAVITGTNIVLDDQIPDIPFTNYSFINESAFKALELIRKDCGNAIAIWFKGNRLCAAYKYYHFTQANSQGEPDAVFKIGYNVVRDGQMKQRKAGDSIREVELYFRKPDGSRIKAKAGVVNSNVEQKKLQAIGDQATLERLAQELEAKKNYTGFEGKLTTFLQPYCEPGFKIRIIDPRYPERSGDYLVESVETRYGRNGARRTIELSFKI